MSQEQSGVIVVDKPAGMTSAAVVARVKRLLGARKVGHAGTLDPFATGVLICLINDATRLSRFFVSGSKQYAATLRLGITTDTQDGTGQIVSTAPVEGIGAGDVAAACAAFVGEIDQAPPVYSALKHQGQPLYKLARQGRPVQKPPRRVQIHRLTVAAVDLPAVRFEVVCSAGTYVRTLATDIGRYLGCGGHLEALARTASGGFSMEEAVALPVLADAATPEARWRYVVPMAEALDGMPAFTADAGLKETIRHGREFPAAVFADAAPGGSGSIKVVDDDGALLAIVEGPDGLGRCRYGGVFVR